MNRNLVIIILFFSVIIIKAQVVYNAYANVTRISGTTFTVNNLTETNHTFAVGEKLLIIQMQDNVIGTNTNNVIAFGDLGTINSAGLYEFNVVSTINRVGATATIVMSTALTNTYNINANASVQLVTFRKLSTAAFTTTNAITGTAWNGTIGGIIAFEVATDLNLAHNITADAIGFRGGGTSTNFSAVPCTASSNTLYTANDGQQGYKGEGIYKVTSTTFTNCRGKIINGGGGGNNHNSGGGGGGNYEQGGLGGLGWNGTVGGCTANPGGGLGGLALGSMSGNRLFMGGGGGGGQQNDGQGSAGGNGGGIILIKASRIVTSGSCGSALQITADGATPSNSGQDGAGGGGAAGSIVFQVNTFTIVGTCSLIVSVDGGNGSSAIHNDVHGGGGAGAQGAVYYSSSTPTTNVLTTANNGTPGCNDNSSPCTSSAGSAGGTNGAGIQPNGGNACTNSNLLYNPSYEFSVVPNLGNNLVGVNSWGGWTIAPSSANFNVIKVNGGAYTGGPNPATYGSQYIDIASASGDLVQGFSLPCTSTINFSGYFSSREAGSYINWTGIIRIISAAGTTVASSTSRNFTSADGAEDQIWYQLTGSVSLAAGSYTYRAVLGNYGNFDNAFLCASNCFLLPIELVSFNASYIKTGGYVDLTWQTASEKNNSHFIIERTFNGQDWVEVKRIPGSGNSKTKKQYQCYDNMVVNRIIYYRLKQVDFDGSSKYSEIVNVDANSDEGIIVYPNPTDEYVTIKSNSLIRELEVTNPLNQLEISSTPNVNELRIRLPESGIHIIKITTENSVVIRKIIRE